MRCALLTITIIIIFQTIITIESDIIPVIIVVIDNETRHHVHVSSLHGIEVKHFANKNLLHYIPAGSRMKPDIISVGLHANWDN
jgi:hypothetical protein